MIYCQKCKLWNSELGEILGLSILATISLVTIDFINPSIKQWLDPKILFLIFYTILKPTKKLVVQRFGARASIRLYHFESGIVRVVNLPVDDILPTIDLLWLFTFLETELKLVFIQFFHPLLGPLFVIFLFPFPQFDYWMPVCCNLLMHICLLKWTNVSENPWWKYTNDTSRQHQTLVCRC